MGGNLGRRRCTSFYSEVNLVYICPIQKIGDAAELKVGTMKEKPRGRAYSYCVTSYLASTWPNVIAPQLISSALEDTGLGGNGGETIEGAPSKQSSFSMIKHFFLSQIQGSSSQF